MPSQRVLPATVCLLPTLLFTLGCSKPEPQAPTPTAAGESGASVPTLEVSSSERIGTFARCGFSGASPSTALLDDFESGLALAGQSNSPHWFRFDDHSGGTMSFATEKSEKDSQYLVVKAQGFASWAGFSLDFGGALQAGQRCAFSAKEFAGVRFRARGHGALRVRVSQADTLPKFQGGTCEAGEACYDQPGAWVHLREEWTNVELPFCGLRVQGWGGRAFETDETKLVDLVFAIESLVQQDDRPMEIALDDIEFYSASEAKSQAVCNVGCPAQSVPEPANVAPQQTYLDVTGPLSLATFEQPTRSCGPLTRRYLTYVPKSLSRNSDAPVLIGLHGYGSNGEDFRETLTRRSFERIADEEGLIIVYGSAAPGHATSAKVGYRNTGFFRQAENNDFEVDDVEYLRLVLADLKRRGITSGENPVYLTGLSNGGGMTLLAASEAPELFRGIAAFMPYVGEVAQPAAPPAPRGSFERILLVHSPGDPGLPPSHTAKLEAFPSAWGSALGLTAAELASPTITKEPNPKNEGADYAGTNRVILATKDSSVLRKDFSSVASKKKMRVLTIERGGHFWPHPVQDQEVWMLESFGLRNQDFDGAQAVWDFFKAP